MELEVPNSGSAVSEGFIFDLKSSSGGVAGRAGSRVPGPLQKSSSNPTIAPSVFGGGAGAGRGSYCCARAEAAEIAARLADTIVGGRTGGGWPPTIERCAAQVPGAELAAEETVAAAFVSGSLRFGPRKAEPGSPTVTAVNRCAIGRMGAVTRSPGIGSSAGCFEGPGARITGDGSANSGISAVVGFCECRGGAPSSTDIMSMRSCKPPTQPGMPPVRRVWGGASALP